MQSSASPTPISALLCALAQKEGISVKALRKALDDAIRHAALGGSTLVLDEKGDMLTPETLLAVLVARMAKTQNQTDRKD